MINSIFLLLIVCISRKMDNYETYISDSGKRMSGTLFDLIIPSINSYALFHVVWIHFHMLEQQQLVNLYIWEFHVSLWLVQYTHTMLVSVFLVKLVRSSS